MKGRDKEGVRGRGRVGERDERKRDKERRKEM